MTWRESLSVGTLLNAWGMIELVIVNVGIELRLLSPTVFSMMVVMAFATTLMTAPLLRRLLRMPPAACREQPAEAVP